MWFAYEILENCRVSKHFGGRPRMPAGQVRDQRVVTFLTTAEIAVLNRFANEKGMSISGACHELIVSGLNDKSLMRGGRNLGENKET